MKKMNTLIITEQDAVIFGGEGSCGGIMDPYFKVDAADIRIVSVYEGSVIVNFEYINQDSASKSRFKRNLKV